ncbi:hypothetical protein M426DRAFT_320671 [Hypoxylon sp. CI-4A]|nr:hypothetical protein M426DRAFT_320671 [Hypoxylon sp. CI-4A]
MMNCVVSAPLIPSHADSARVLFGSKSPTPHHVWLSQIHTSQLLTYMIQIASPVAKPYLDADW